MFSTHFFQEPVYQTWAISGFAWSIRYDIDMRHQNLTPTRRDDIYETKTRPQRDETIFMRPKLDPNETPTIFGSYCVNDTIRYIVHIVHIHQYLVYICRYSLNIPSIFPRYSLDIPSPSLPPSLIARLQVLGDQACADQQRSPPSIRRRQTWPRGRQGPGGR